MSDPTIDGLATRRLISRIIDECETIEEDGFDRVGASNWYSTDRLQAIRDVIDLALQGDPFACVDGFGNPRETPEERARYFDRDWERRHTTE